MAALENELTQLAKEVRAAVTARKATGTIPTLRQILVRRRNFSLKYRNDFGFANFPPERIEEDIWDWRDQVAFQDSVVKTLPEYKALVAAYRSDTNKVEAFTRSVAHASFYGLAETQLTDRVKSFARDLQGQPLPVKVTAFLSGVSIAEPLLRISDHLTLRKPTPEDVTEQIVLDEFGGLSIPIGDTYFDVVGDFTCDAVSTGMAQREFLRTIEALRLFRVGGVSANRYEMCSEHSFPGGRGILSGPSRHSRFSFALSNSDAPDLGRFISGVSPLLPDPLREQGTAAKELALLRYNDALFQGGPPEQPITSAITALEALFLEGETELTHRLAQRVSVFLRALGTQTDSVSTYATMKKGYDIRSKFIHGGFVSKAARPQAEALAPTVLNYARQSTLAFFQVAQSKAELICKIDRATIDPAAVPTLEFDLATVVHK